MAVDGPELAECAQPVGPSRQDIIPPARSDEAAHYTHAFSACKGNMGVLGKSRHPNKAAAIAAMMPRRIPDLNMLITAQQMMLSDFCIVFILTRTSARI